MGDPIHQFQISNLFMIGHFGRWDIYFTNSAAFMIVAVLLICGFLLLASRPHAMVPGRLQSAAEMTYEFVAKTVRDNAGTEGMKFLPLVFALFSFVLVANLMGLIPFSFTVMSHIIITATMALLVFFTVVIYGFYRNGVRFLRVFVPSGIPIYILPLVSLIEVISFLTRPLSHSVRLFANMLAGHITLQVFAGFVVMLSAIGF